MPTTGIHRRPATSSTSGLTKPATNRITRRVRGPRLNRLMSLSLLILPGRATPSKSDKWRDVVTLWPSSGPLGAEAGCPIFRVAPDAAHGTGISKLLNKELHDE